MVKEDKLVSIVVWDRCARIDCAEPVIVVLLLRERHPKRVARVLRPHGDDKTQRLECIDDRRGEGAKRRAHEYGHLR